MTPEQFKAFSSFRNDFKKKISEWSRFNDDLISLQEAAAAKGSKSGTADYKIETPVCYNTTLDEVTEEDDIKLIVIGDNPGKNEQLEKNRRYLVGLAGKLGEKFFAENPELGTDFRKNVIILNKTPVHSARTEHLHYIIKNGRPEIAELIQESQVWMAEATARLHMALCQGAAAESQSVLTASQGATQHKPYLSQVPLPQLWLVGYAELKGKGLFLSYRDTLLETYKNAGKQDLFTDTVFTFQHFSMNRFTIDLNDFRKKQGGTAPQSKQGGTAPYSKQGGTDPYSKQKGTDPLSKQEGTDPLSKQGGTNPYSKQGGTDPLSKQEGTDPQSKQGGTDPYFSDLSRDLKTLGSLHRKDIFGV
ncbi:MAG: hypothetical protein KIG91_04050 [Treponema sp.]|nr:hypothetical protein [Treponema sp.]